MKMKLQQTQNHTLCKIDICQSTIQRKKKKKESLLINYNNKANTYSFRKWRKNKIITVNDKMQQNKKHVINQKLKKDEVNRYMQQNRKWMIRKSKLHKTHKINTEFMKWKHENTLNDIKIYQ